MASKKGIPKFDDLDQAHTKRPHQIWSLMTWRKCISAARSINRVGCTEQDDEAKALVSELKDEFELQDMILLL